MNGKVYNSIANVGWPYKLRGTNQQTDTGLLWRTPSMRQYPVGGGAYETIYTPGMALASFAVHNRSGSTCVVGIGVRVPNHLWKFGLWTDGTTTFTDDTTDAQDAGTDDVALETVSTNNSGYIVASRVKFNCVSLNISTASSGGTPVRAVRFPNAAGTGWQTAESNLLIPATTAGDYATGEEIVAFAEPVDWGKSSSLATGLGDGYYVMNVRATTAPSSTAGLATAVEVWRMYYVTEAVADNAVLDQVFTSELVMGQELDQATFGDALGVLISTANDQNRVSCQVRAL